MYVVQSNACDQPNSETPITAAQVTAQDAYVSRVGNKFVSGNQTMSDIIGYLTPPAPGGSCDDLLSSNAFYNSSPFPQGGGIPDSGAVSIPVPTLVTAAGTAAPSSSAVPGGSTSPAAPGSPATNGGSLSNAGVNYPANAAQQAISMLVPPACVSRSGSYAPTIPAVVTASQSKAAMWIGIGVLVVLGAALASGDGK